ncbi:FUSC family protein [Subtercola endophyticus]|uniref:FUSC family protein n=1 Tax=Subtercola endophyticus TaxID=2895559 RepID=UPI001E5B218D|nr:FUSC family protein [Subtercola endophyticus]UFS59980.1 FUSC family protein [Subtercola endophyticus]
MSAIHTRVTSQPHSPAPVSFSRSLVTIGRDASAPRAALRVGVSVLVPLVVLYALGHPEWSIFGAFGAFTSVYGRTVLRGARLRMQTVAAVVMVVSVALGSVVAPAPAPASEWMTVLLGAVWAMIVALISQAARWTPPGPLFAVFALCAVASIPVPSVTGANSPAGVNVLVAVVVSGASAAFALLVGQAHAVLRAPSASIAAPSTPSPTGSAAITRLRSVLGSRESLLSAARFGVALAVAGSLSTLLQIGHPYWAMVAAVVPLVAFDLAQTMVRGAHRVLGTLVGLVVAWGLLLLHPAGLWAILLVVALQIAAELMILRNYGVALIFITPLALVMVSMAHPTDPTALITDRGLETVLGTLVAVVVALVWSGIRTARERGREGRVG